MLHKNAKNIIWLSGKTIHVFDRANGARIHKSHWNSTQHVVFFNPVNKRFCWMDCACYSYLYVFDIKEYDPLLQIAAEKGAEVEPPIVLDEVKQNIRKELIEAFHEEEKDSEEAKDGEEIKKKLRNRKRPAFHAVNTLMGIEKP